MPRFDRTGPEGQGSQTGRGLGKCNSGNKKLNEQTDVQEHPKVFGKHFGKGMGKGLGLGKGSGRGVGRRLGRGNS